jgi:hypothetical protein
VAGTAVLFVGLALLTAGATCVAALLRVQGAVAFVLASVLLAFGEVVAVSHALSVVGAYRRDWFLATLAVIALTAAVAALLVRPPKPAVSPLPALREIGRDRLLVGLGLLVAVELGYVLALAVFTPPNGLDGLQYHLTRAVLWIQAGAVGPIGDATDARINEFQPDAEIVQGATMLLSRSVRWVGLVQFIALLASMLAIYGLAGRIGLDRRKAVFGALLFATLPVVALQASTAENDVVVAALVASAAFFVLGRTGAELSLACLAVALLVGTKVTGVLALPVLVCLAVLSHHGRRLVLLLAAGVGAVLVGGAWLGVNISAGNGLFGRQGDAQRADLDSGLAVAARATRHAIEAFELPGAVGRDRFLYLLAAVVLAGVGIVRRQPSVAAFGAALTALPLLVLPAEAALHSIYWHGWELVGYEKALELGASRDSTLASEGHSWYGPVGLALTLAALALTLQSARRRRVPWVAVVLAAAPFVFLLGSSLAIEYDALHGRLMMGGVALSAATWGLVLRFPSGSAAIVAVATTTVILSLVNSVEKPMGIELLERTDRPSVWTLPRAWVQNTQPELARITEYIDQRTTDGDTIGLTRDAWVRPFVYVGYPGMDHRIVYADSLEEATRRRSEWAILPMSVHVAPGWRLVLRSPPWAIFHHEAGASREAG